MEDLHGDDLRSGSRALEGINALLFVIGAARDDAGNVGAVALIIGHIIVLFGVVIRKRNLRVEILAGCDRQSGVVLGHAAGHLAAAVGILEGLMRGVQAGVEHGDHNAAAVHAEVGTRLIRSGHDRRADSSGLSALFQHGRGIVVGDVDRVDAVNGSDLIQIAIGNVAAEAVEQRIVGVLHLIIDTAHGLADLVLAGLDLLAGGGLVGRAALGQRRRRCVLQHDDGTDNVRIGVLVDVFAEGDAAVALGLRVADLLHALQLRGRRLCGESRADAAQRQNQREKQRKNTLELLHGFFSFSY